MISETKTAAIAEKNVGVGEDLSDEEAAKVLQAIVLELGRFALGLPSEQRNAAADRATLKLLGTIEFQDTDNAFWEVFYRRLKDDPQKAIEYLSQRINKRSLRMKKIRHSPKRNSVKTSLAEIENLLKQNPRQSSSDLWHALRKSSKVNHQVTSLLADEIVFNDGERIKRSGFKQRVIRVAAKINS